MSANPAHHFEFAHCLELKWNVEMKCKISFCVGLSFLDIILNFALILLMNGLFKRHPGDQDVSVEGENKIF